MTGAFNIRHVVAIAGLIREPPPHTTTPNGNNNGNGSGIVKAKPPVRIADALVEIVVEEAPPVFQQIVAVRKADPTWSQRRERIDRTWSQADGIFHFINLPPGDYQLRVSVPRAGTRYGTVTTKRLTVNPNPPEKPVKAAWVEVEVPLTRIYGQITNDETHEPVVGAHVYLRGETKYVQTTADGHYELLGLVASSPMVEASADHFRAASRRVTMLPGQERMVNLKLTPEP